MVKRKARLSAMLCVAVCLLYLWFGTHPHYDLNDDTLLMRAFGGMVGGVAEAFNPCTHVLLGGLLLPLHTLFPTVPWYSVLQVALLVCAAYATLRSTQTAAVRMGLRLWQGTAAGTAFVLAFLLEPMTSVTFTRTASALGCAAVLSLLAAETRVRTVLPSLGWLLCAYLLRTEALAPLLCFWLGALGCKWLAEGAPFGRVAAALAALALFGTLAVGGEVAWRLSDEGEYRSWQQARSRAIDYGGLQNMSEETRVKLGWTEAQSALAANWCFLDQSASEAALRTAAEAHENHNSLPQAVACVRQLGVRYRNVHWAVVSLAGLCMLAFALALWQSRRLWACLAPLLCALAAGALLLFLAWRGRLPMRAAMTVLLPANAWAFWLALRGAAAVKGSRALQTLCVLLCFALLLPCAKAAWHATYNPSPKPTASVHTRVEQYALAHPGQLYIAEGALGTDSALLPDWRGGKPPNLLMGWGSWNNRSAGYRAAFRAFGYAHDAFTIADFVDSPLRLMTREDTHILAAQDGSLYAPEGDAALAAFLQVMWEQTGGGVAAVPEARAEGFLVWRFTNNP